MRHLSSILLVALILFSSYVAAADTTQSSVNASSTNTKEVNASVYEAWGLTKQDWTRYEEIMQGPRGIWSPGLDPLTALGNHARTDAERKRLAEIAARVETERSFGEQKWQHAYDAAHKRLYPNATLYPVKAGSSIQRYHVYINNAKKLNITHSGIPIGEVVSSLSKKHPVDIFFSNGADKDIRAWAENHRISPKDVLDKKITLNHNIQKNVARPFVIYQVNANNELEPFVR